MIFFEEPVRNSNTGFSNEQQIFKQHQEEIGKNQLKAKQHPQAELLLFENYLLSSCMSLSRNRAYSKECALK